MAKDASSRNAVAQVRATLAQAIWLACAACALVLALGALLVALDANQGNELVQFIKDAASAVDLGVFDRRAGVFDFRGDGADVKNALVNWGIAAVVWLVVGRILDRIVRP